MATDTEAPIRRERPVRSQARRESRDQAAARSSAVAVVDPQKRMTDLEAMIEKRRDAITKSLPALVEPDRFVSLALYAIGKQPRLLECTPDSIIRGLRDSASLGLMIGSALGQAALVPFYNSKRKRYEAVFIPQYEGLLDLSYRSDRVEKAEARVVYDCDEFVWEPTALNPIQHRPVYPRPETAKRLGAYFVAWLKGARAPITEYMPESEIEGIRKRSRAGDDGPWITDPDAMWRKTVTRRAMHYMPKSTELREALAIEARAESSPEYARPPQAAGVRRAHADVLEAVGVGGATQPEVAVSEDIVEGEVREPGDDDQSTDTPVEAEADQQDGQAGAVGPSADGSDGKPDTVTSRSRSLAVGNPLRCHARGGQPARHERPVHRARGPCREGPQVDRRLVAGVIALATVEVPPRPADPRCSAPLGRHDESTCNRPPFRIYVGTDGQRYGFCSLAGHAMTVVALHPGVPGTQTKVS